jgi:mRNA interferase MazF
MNQSQSNTVIVFALTTNLRRANAPGNVLLNLEEADLPEQSVVNVSQVFTLDKSQLQEKIGALSRKRIRRILDGVKLLIEPTD